MCGFGHSVSFSSEVKNRVRHIPNISVGNHDLFCCNYAFSIEQYRRKVFVIHHVEDYCVGNRCAGISLYKQDGTLVVTHCNFYESCYYSEC